MPIDTRKSLVKKFNPNHGADGRFTSGSSGLGARRIGERGGGTAGPPVKDAFGNPLGIARAGAAAIAASQKNLPWTGSKQTVAAHSPNAQQAAAHVHGASDKGTNKSVPIYHTENAAQPGFQFSSAQRQANAREMFGAGPIVSQGPSAGDRGIVPQPKGPDKWSQYAKKPYDPYGETVAETPKEGTTPNILIRPDPYGETIRTPKGFSGEPPITRARSADVIPPKEGTIHVKPKDVSEYPTRRNEGESLKSYVERRNLLLKAQRDRDAKLAKARAPKGGAPPTYARSKSPTTNVHDRRRVR